ncbi:hypothetical protein IF2G_06323 [Cordyceps javanica]|nr:hypothetical protein IF2G_06323 [Cordyceps javanica]
MGSSIRPLFIGCLSPAASYLSTNTPMRLCTKETKQSLSSYDVMPQKEKPRRCTALSLAHQLPCCCRNHAGRPPTCSTVKVSPGDIASDE